jgi:hypothetical protein
MKHFNKSKLSLSGKIDIMFHLEIKESRKGNISLLRPVVLVPASSIYGSNFWPET